MSFQVGLRALEQILSACIALGALWWVAVLGSAFFFRSRRPPGAGRFAVLPPVTLLKPVYGLEKGLRENLRTACNQDYPEYQVVFSVQRRNDPALPVLLELAREFGPERVSVAVEAVVVGMNGKINNLAGALLHARHAVLVVSDSDVRLAPDFLAQIVAPLADPTIGAVTSFFRATNADSWFERLELLGLNADQFAMALLASATGLVDFCFGVSTALDRRTLESIGGLPALGNFLVEDTEMGRRIVKSGRRVVAIPLAVDMTVDLESPRAWAEKQVYWERNTLAAVPTLFAAGLLLRIIPLSLLLATLRGWDARGVEIVLLACGTRVLSAAAVLGVALRDGEGLRALWLLPFKDVMSMVWWFRALLTRSITWRGVQLSLERGGRLSGAAATRSTTERGS